MSKYVDKRDCYIERNYPGYPASAVLFDGDGEIIYRFNEDWTDNQIWMALAFANKAYNAGENVGRVAKASEIRAALYL